MDVLWSPWRYDYIKSGEAKTPTAEGGCVFCSILNSPASDEEKFILPRKEFELLALLAGKPGKVFTRDEILDKVWGNDIVVGDRTIDVHIRKIRQKLGLDCITTVKGVGYKFVN